MTGVACGTGNAYPSGASEVHVILSLVSCLMWWW